MTIANYDVKRILIDNESFIDVLFYDALSKINLLNNLRQVGSPLIGFSYDSMTVEEEITLSIIIEKEPYQSTIQLTYLVIKIPFAYNAILDQPRLNAPRAIVSTFHLLVQFSIRLGVREMRGDQTMAK